MASKRCGSLAAGGIGGVVSIMLTMIAKTLLPVGLLLLLGLPPMGAAIQGGDTREQVFEALSEPTGTVQAGDRPAHSFDRSRVILERGRVTSHSIVSESAAREPLAEAERQRKARTQRGEELPDRRSEDPDFAETPPEDRLAFRHSFRQRFPELDVSFEQFPAARQTGLAQQRRMHDLDRRLMEEDRLTELRQRRAPPIQAGSSTGLGAVFPGSFGPQFPTTALFVDPILPPQFQPRPPSARQRFMAFNRPPFPPLSGSSAPKFHPPVHTPKHSSSYPSSRGIHYSSGTPSRSHYPGGGR